MKFDGWMLFDFIIHKEGGQSSFISKKKVNKVATTMPANRIGTLPS